MAWKGLMRTWSGLALAMVLGLGGGCGTAAPPAVPARPSIVVVVIDTLRADAVSSYGRVRGTTRHLDALAARGVRFAHAYAPAPWTTPSHVTLLSGVAPERHRVGVSERITVPPDLVMLAERLRDAGYETAGFGENPLVGAPFGLDQGFTTFAVRSLEQLMAEFRRPGSSGYDVERAISDWVTTRDARRPFFAFVNLFEAHEPYLVRPENPFLPAGVTAEAAARVRHGTHRICSAIAPPDELVVLRGLYLGDVAAADATLGRIMARLDAAVGQPFLTIVTSDHGEHFGERRLVDHQFTVDDAAVHVPLVVAGPGVAPATIDTPVTLADVTASILAWAGVHDAPVDGLPLPLTAGAAPERDLVSLYADRTPTDWPFGGAMPGADGERKRAACGPDDRVRGDMAALVRFPWKLVWYERYPPQLFDLGRDPDEQTDRSGAESERLATMKAALDARLREAGVFERREAPPPRPEAVETLRGLGYVE